jgi:hypothetical protein
MLQERRLPMVEAKRRELVVGVGAGSDHRLLGVIYEESHGKKQ